ncbi:molybdenum cofactor biosysynthesis protein [uncultured Jatrophihabitans sp.]|uniref:molybdenum cofactor biosysynthesis protein n=1 Tax=uncultured Jatrophihabitans sp. TaxID=1610747 RepID=UPI0035CA3B88
MPEIVQLLTSGASRLDGRPAPLASPLSDETTDHLTIRAGLGVVGDRYFNRPAHRDASVTLLAIESLAAWPGSGLRETRRNVLLRGVEVDGARGRVLSLDSGDGPVLMLLHRAAHPCAWMDHTLGPGAWRALRGHGGMRCEPLTDGVLRVGPVAVAWHDGEVRAAPLLRR